MATRGQSIADEKLLRGLAEELKLPLTQIARQSELIELSNIDDNEWLSHDLAQLGLTAQMAIRLVDGFLLSNRLQRLDALPLEPVSLSSTLTEVAHELQPIAKQNNCDILVSLSGKYGPAMAHRESLNAALVLLGHSVIEGWNNHEDERRRHEVVLGAHRSHHGLVAGVYDNDPSLGVEVLRSGRKFLGTIHQSMPSVSSTNGAGVFIADSLLREMAAPLHVSRHEKLTGLASTFSPSQQLQFV